jgi:2-polyprenyl-3-methyl-5-hydroxy-6-metoxy-1,4-benzoquinol methylase
MKIDKLPFYWRLKRKNARCPVPEWVPFAYDFDEGLQLLIQKRDKTTLEYLKTIYTEDANIGYLQDANEIAKPYGTDFFRFIETSLVCWGAHVRRVLEIGCGGCTILSELKNSGYEVVGIDPGPLAWREGERRGIQIINGFFPTSQFEERVDFIFHNDVLEHVDDPVGFLEAQRMQLNADGLVISAVPDCSEGVLTGELSMTMHQHLNYYDLESLKNVFEAAGMEVLSIERALYGGSLYCCARNPKKQAIYQPKNGREKFLKFTSDADRNIRNFSALVDSWREDGGALGSLGFYAPLRALPYLALLGIWKGFRFFDDTNSWYGLCFDGVDVPIENFSDLRANPVDSLFIMSITFGEKIFHKIREAKIPCGRVVTLQALLDAGKLCRMPCLTHP